MFELFRISNESSIILVLVRLPFDCRLVWVARVLVLEGIGTGRGTHENGRHQSILGFALVLDVDGLGFVYTHVFRSLV